MDSGDEENEGDPPPRAVQRGVEQEEDPARPLRRADAAPEPAEGEEPPVSPARNMRRAVGDEAEEEDIQAVRRMGAAPPPPDEMEPAEELRGEEEPSAVTALRRNVVPAPLTAVSAAEAPAPLFDTGYGDFHQSGDAAPAAPLSFERPVVQIDQLDVLIHEPAAQSRRAAIGNSRAIRARYLRRL